MGFGLLFIGYLLTFLLSLTKFGFAIRLLGYAVTARALIKLRDYEPGFAYPMGCSFFLIIIGIVNFIIEGAGELAVSLPDWVPPAKGAVDWVEFAVNMALNISLLLAIALFAKKLDLKKQRVSAWRNMVFVGIYFILHTLGAGPFAGNETYSRYFRLPTFLVQLAWVFLNLALIFSCYMYICPAGDEAMPRGKSKIKFLEKLNEESDRRVEKARKDTGEYYAKQQNNGQNKQNRKRKK